MPGFATGQILGVMIALGGSSLLPSSFNSEIVQALFITVRVGMVMSILGILASSAIRFYISRPHNYRLAFAFSTFAVITSVGFLSGFYWADYDTEAQIANITTPSVDYYNTVTEFSNNSELVETFTIKHSVSEGESLWKIAKLYYGNGSSWTLIRTSNNAKLIHPGDVVEVPDISMN